MSKRLFTEEQERVIVARYEAGASTVVLAREHNTVPQSINNLLQRRGVRRRTELCSKKLTPEQDDALATMLKNGASRAEAAAAFGSSVTYVREFLQAREMTMRVGRRPTCLVNHNAFDALTPECLYWMGFLFADGCISKEKTAQARLVLGLAVRDRDHVEKLRAFAGSTHAITIGHSRTAKGGPCAYVAIRSQPICDTLRSRGMYEKHNRIPSPITAKSRDFWRGAVDGDGWIGTTAISETRISPFIGLSGQRPIVEMFCRYVRDELGIPTEATTRFQEESNVFRFQISDGGAIRVIKNLYLNSVVALDRKNVRAQAMIREPLRIFPSYFEGPSCIEMTDELMANASLEKTAV